MKDIIRAALFGVLVGLAITWAPMTILFASLVLIALVGRLMRVL